MEPAPRVLANRYQLETQLGRGGMGIVYRALDLDLERAVAIKLLADPSDHVVRERFLVEARRTASIRHPAIVEVFDVGQDGDDTFIVMELLDGEPLDAMLTRDKRLGVELTLRIASQICDALAAAHEAGVVHRDLKPANVYVVRADDDALRVKLLDFGIAKRLDGKTARTDPGVLVGTLEYMSPEQILGGPLDGRSDLYALGLTIHRALIGTAAYDADNVAAMIHHHLNVEPPAMAGRAPWLGERADRLDDLFFRFVAKKVGDRFASARDAKRAIVSVLEGTEDGLPRRATPNEASRAGSMRMVDLAGAEGPPIELALASPPPPVDPTKPRVVRPVDVAADVLPLRSPPLPLGPVSARPAWIEPFVHVPTAISKSVLVASLVAFVVYNVFAHGAVTSLLLLAVAAIGGLCLWLNARYSS